MSQNSFVLLFFIFVAAFLVGPSKEDEGNDDIPLVSVQQGLIKGIKEKSINEKEFYSYMKIPFAEPPTGNLRFKEPVPSKSWQGVLDGTKMPVPCLQPNFFDIMSTDRATTILHGKEDCLYLNVFTDVPNERGKKLPVMVFIHGGAFIVGGAQEHLPYVLMNEDIVLVVIQYRLGIFGFLSTEDSVLPGNMGLKDQQLALKWIKENIEAFGGDPDMITIFGESAGGGAVHYHILSPGSKGLFKKAIMQSGTALCPWASNVNHRKFAIETGSQFNCSIDLGTETYLECMQKVNPLYLVIASTANKWGMTPFYVLPRVDGDFISEPPEVLMKKGKYNKVDIIAGITRNEGAIDLLTYFVDPTRRDTINQNFDKYGPYSIATQDEENPVTLTREIYQHYLQREDTTIRDDDKLKLVQLNTDVFFRVCHDRVANFFAGDDDMNLFLYQLDHVGQHSLLNFIPGFNNTDNLVAHGDDLAYLFQGGILFKGPMENKEDLKLRETILSLWVTFAKTGNPNTSDSGFTWEKATTRRFGYLSLTPNPQMEEDTFDETRKFWSSLKTRQNYNLQRTESKKFSKQEL